MLDSSALLAHLKGEPGRELVALSFRDASMSIVNWAEVLSKMAERGVPPELVARRLRRERLLDRGFMIPPLPRAHADTIGRLRPLTRNAGLSLGDRACLALAIDLNAPILTTDRALAAVDLPVEVRLLR